MEIPENVERIIRGYIRLLPHNEWSGVLFYKVEGDFTSPEFKIICQDILLMDIGEGAHTQFTTERLIADYMADHIELLDCYNGLVHSHHVLGAFFSGEDRGTIQQEGINRNNFVSLVVDTRGTYVAAITRRLEINTVYTPHSEAHYPFFALRDVPISISAEPDSIEKKQYIVQWFPLEVVRHEVSDSDDYVDRFAELLLPMLRSQLKPYTSPAVQPHSYTSFGDSINKTSQPAPVPQRQYAWPSSYDDTDDGGYPELPFPGTSIKETKDTVNKKQEIKELVDESYDDLQQRASSLKDLCMVDETAFHNWLIQLIAGTPLKCLTEHIIWSSASVKRLMDSWKETCDESLFSEFMTEWIPLCINFVPEDFFFLDEALLTEDNDLMLAVFSLKVKEALEEALEFDSYAETIFEILTEELICYQ